ncbi:CHAT domain-containing protein [Chloroflexus sp.]|uniref:CHAT domain-containing protein n=1 Tax=Chloroflexus sp. TaxID=1904827 RepID=UPI002ADD35CE|nr:CHAT domain-containing protein [Chloroflexus sp.]
MPLTITLRRIAADRAEVSVAGQRLALFEPAALRENQPFTSKCDSVEYGRCLMAALGGQELQEHLARIPLAPNLNSMVAIQTDDAELAVIPWEFLHDGNEFLIFRYLLVREVPATHALPPPPTAQLWRLVVMGSDPLLGEQYDAQRKFCELKPVPRLKVAWELDTLCADLQQRQPPVPFRWQRIAPTRAALIDELATTEPILFHFVGHGSVVNGIPMLCFDDGAGKLDLQPASDLADHLRGMVMLAFLNACRTADSVEPGANLALTLVQHGIPVVVGNQYLVIDEAAAPVACTFYRYLAATMHPAQALYRARLQLRNHLHDQPQQWAMPVIYLAQGYQWPQCPPAPTSSLPPIEPPLPVLTALSAPDYQAGRFVGRERELWELASLFVHDQKKIVTIRGPGGIGKTALVAALAHRLRFVFSDGIVALSLVLPGEQAGLNAADVRRQLASLLGIRVEDSSVWPADERAQENILVEHLQRRRRLLLIWDNYETVLWRLGRETEPDASADVFSAAQQDEATAVQRLVRRLADSGVSMLFTSRQSPVGVPGEVCFPSVESGQLPGLSSRASEEFMRRLISLRNPSETFLNRLAAAVDYHPLAMQLAITRWDRGQDDEDTFLNNLDHELVQARDPAAPMYQQTSVEINIRLSLHALPNELQEALLTLTIIANPIITPLHAAVVWGLEDEQQWQIGSAHRQLEALQQNSLLQGIGYDPAHNRAQAYSLQPVIAGFLRREAQRREAKQTLDMHEARQRYARWADVLVARAYDPRQGINADPDLAQEIQFFLPDLAAALPALTDADRGWTYWQAACVFARMGDLATAQRMIDLATPLAQTDEALRSRVYHQQADVLVTRGDLDQALALYQQSLDLNDRLGDVHGKSATLLMMAQIMFMRGDHQQALQQAYAALQTLERIGAAPDAAKAREIIALMEAACTQAGGAGGSAAAVSVTPARLLGMLIAMVVQARGEQIHPDQVRAALTQLPPAAPWPAVRDALLAALDGTADAASHLLAAAPPLLAQGTAAEQGDALAGIGNLGELLSDRATERQAREDAVAAFRTAGDDRQSLISLSVALYNLAMCYVNQGEVAVAIPLLEEVVALDERTGHPDLAQDRATLEALRRHLAGLPEPTLVEAIMAWRNGNGDEAQLVALINRICHLYVRTMREGSPAQREELANDLAELRAAPSLPIPGARDFLGVLQLRLRDAPGMAERAAQMQATLPEQWVDVLERMERDVAGEPVDTSASPMADNRMMTAAATLAAQLEQLPPAQRAEVQVLLQVTPLLIGAMALLNQDHAHEQRTAFVQVLEQAADQAAAGEAEGSPWLKAAAVLRTLAGWLTGKPVNVDELAEPYRSVVQQMRGD